MPNAWHTWHTLIAAGSLAALGCTTNAETGDQELRVDAEFHSLRLTSVSEMCPSNPFCRDLAFEADGDIVDRHGMATLSSDDLERFAAVATGAEFIDALRSGRDCREIMHQSVHLTVRIGPGLEAFGSATCDGVVGDVKQIAESLAAEAIGLNAPEEPITWTDPEPARIAEPAVFYEYRWDYMPTECPAGERCTTGVAIGSDGYVRRGGAYTELPEQELADFIALATSASTLSALMQEAPCPESTVANARLRLGVAKGLAVVGEVAGCEDGPIADLVQAATDLADRFLDEP